MSEACLTYCVFIGVASPTDQRSGAGTGTGIETLWDGGIQ